MQKKVECITVKNSDLAKICSEKIKSGWEIELATPDSLSGTCVLTYKLLVSKSEK